VLYWCCQEGLYSWAAEGEFAENPETKSIHGHLFFHGSKDYAPGEVSNSSLAEDLLKAAAWTLPHSTFHLHNSPQKARATSPGGNSYFVMPHLRDCNLVLTTAATPS
jgi:hypothetical protein